MSDLKPQSAMQRDQDGWLKKNAWILSFLEIDLTAAPRKLDALGLDVPRTPVGSPPQRPVHDALDLQAADEELPFRRTEPERQMADLAKTLDGAPQADVPERDLARAAGAKLQDLLARTPLPVADARSALTAFGKAVPLAVAAMEKTRDERDLRAAEAARLTPPDDADKDLDQKALGQLETVRAEISEALDGDEPSAAGVERAADLLRQGEGVLASLREAIAARLALARRELAANAEALQKTLDTAPQADVPARTAARVQKAALDELVNAEKLAVAPAQEALGLFGKLVTAAIEAMQEMVALRASLLEAESRLAPPPEVDPEEDKTALGALEMQRSEIGRLLAPEVPVEKDLNDAQDLVEAYGRAAQDLAEAVQRRLAEARERMAAAAAEEIKGLSVFGPVDPGMLTPVTGLHKALGVALPGGALTVKGVKRAEILLGRLQQAAGVSRQELAELDRRRKAAEERLNAVTVPKSMREPIQQKIATARLEVETAIKARLSTEGVGEVERVLGLFGEVYNTARRARTIRSEMRAVSNTLSSETTLSEADGSTIQYFIKSIDDLCDECTKTSCDSAESELAKFKTLNEEIKNHIEKTANFTEQVRLLEGWYEAIPPEFQRTGSAALFVAYEKALGEYYDGIYKSRGEFDEQTVNDAIDAIRAAVDDVAEAYAVVKRKQEAEAAAAEEERQKAKNRKPFDPKDRGTWDPVAPSIVKSAQKFVQDNPNIVARIRDCVVADRHGGTSVTTGVPMHQHGDLDKTGVAFAYSHMGGRQVQPVIYDFSTSRQGDKFEWRVAKLTDGGPPKLPKSVKGLMT
jgi:hypothetical protein